MKNATKPVLERMDGEPRYKTVDEALHWVDVWTNNAEDALRESRDITDKIEKTLKPKFMEALEKQKETKKSLKKLLEKLESIQKDLKKKAAEIEEQVQAAKSAKERSERLTRLAAKATADAEKMRSKATAVDSTSGEVIDIDAIRRLLG